MTDTSLDSIPDDALLAHVRRLTARSNLTLAELLAHLGEVERRGIHRLRACASLHTYCIYELRMSEDAAFRRAKAARLVREHPELRAMIAKGEIHLTGLLLLAPVLGGERHAEALARARFRTKREIAQLVALLDPKPEIPARIEPLGPAPLRRPTHAELVASLAGPVRHLREGDRPEDWVEAEDAAPANAGVQEEEGRPSVSAASKERAAGSRIGDGDASDGARGEASRPLHYKVQFTANQEYVDLVDEAFDLLSHEMRTRDLARLQLRALRAFVAELSKRKRAAGRQDDGVTRKAPPAARPAPARAVDEIAGVERTAPERAADEPPATGRRGVPGRPKWGVGEAGPDAAPEETVHVAPRPAPGSRAGKRSRHVPVAVARAVWARDGSRCAFIDDLGTRCRETRTLELHHRLAFARGGPSTVENLEVRCRAHNELAAQMDFGPAHGKSPS